MHPYAHGQMHHFRAESVARKAAARTHHLMRPPVFGRRGTHPRTSPVDFLAIRGTVAGFKNHVGLALIRVGLRFVDPVASIRALRR